MAGYVFYRGPSRLDGAPIVAIAILSSGNRKTGDMVQTYILRSDVAPTVAVRDGRDASICGDCKHRPVNGGACYVVVAQGPTSVYRAYQRGLYPQLPADYLSSRIAGRMVRLGTYGDPAAVPARLWVMLLAQSAGHTGYTHQWANPVAADLRTIVMASVDTPAERIDAAAAGWRTFRVRMADEPIARREFICPASAEAGKRKLCAECGACDGAQRAGQASPVIIAHGSKASRFIAIRSI